MEKISLIQEVRNHFKNEYSYIDMDSLQDAIIWEFMNRSYIIAKNWAIQMDCLYDYILSQGLTEVQE